MRLIASVLVLTAVLASAASVPAHAAVSAASAVSGGAVLAQQGYRDIADAGVHRGAVEALAARGIFRGTDCAAGSFCPGEPLPRWVMAVWLVRLLDGEEPQAQESRFADIEGSPWWEGHVERLAEARVTLGCDVSPARFCPDGTVTRGQMAAFLTRALNLGSAPSAGFMDTAGSVFEENIDSLYEARFTLGCATDPLRYCPRQFVTRAQMASFLNRAFPNEETGPPLSEVYPDRLRMAKAALSGSILQSNRQDDSCPMSKQADTMDYVVVLRLDDGCLITDEYDLNGRTLKQAREEYGRDPTVLAVDRPVESTTSASLQRQGPDPDLSRQWHLGTGFLNAEGLSGEWPGGSIVRVAVIDSGVDTSHADLANSIHEINHPAYRYRVVENKCDNGDWDRDPDGHGTHVAGIVAAERSNGLDGAGVAPRAKVVPIAILLKDIPPHPRDLGLEDAINCAVMGGVDIISLSIITGDYSTLRAQIELALSSGVIVVAAAGNCGTMNPGCSRLNEIRFPAAYPGVISVAASDMEGQRASFSTANGTVTIAAPGEDIWSTQAGGGMTPKSGTSMSTPAISGVVAHLVARFPEATPDDISEALYNTAYPTGPGTRSHELGHGIVRPLAAIDYLCERDSNCGDTSLPPVAHIDGFFGIGYNAISASWSVDDNGSPIVEWEVNDDGLSGEPSGEDLEYSWSDVPAGIHTISVRVRNAGGWSEWASTDVLVTDQPDCAIPPVTALNGTLGEDEVTFTWSSVDIHDVQCAEARNSIRYRIEYSAPNYGLTTSSLVPEFTLEAEELSRLGPGEPACVEVSTALYVTSYGLLSGEWANHGWTVSLSDPRSFCVETGTEPERESPDRPSIRASAGENRASASWSADDNGSPILEWDVDDDGMPGGPRATATSHEWTAVPAGTYTIRVRARNAGGWSPEASATVRVTDAPPPTVSVSKGALGPTSGAEVNDAPCAPNSTTCRWLEVALRDFPPGTYRGLCIHEGFRWSNGNVSDAGWWNEFNIEVGASGTASASRPCYINFAAVLGRGARISINIDGTWIGSNWIEPVAERSVSLQKGASAQGWTGCSSVYCRHLQITLGSHVLEGNYEVECWSSRPGDDPWYTQVVHWPSSSLWSQGLCWFGYPGEKVWVVVGNVKSNVVTW